MAADQASVVTFHMVASRDGVPVYASLVKANRHLVIWDESVLPLMYTKMHVIVEILFSTLNVFTLKLFSMQCNGTGA